MIFEQQRWPIHSALAWVLTRDRFYTEQADTITFLPYIADDSFASIYDHDLAWEALFEAITEGRIRAFGTPFANPGDFSILPKSDMQPEEEIPTELIKMLAWTSRNGRPCLCPPDWRLPNERLAF
jgi:hypothetical protein